MKEEKKGFFGRLVAGLAKTRNNIVSGFESVFSGFSRIDDDFYEELEEILGHIPAEPDQPVPPTPPAPAPEPEPEEGEPLEPEEQESDGAVMEPASLTTEELEHMAVVKLRAVARQIGLTSMTRKEIRFAKKEELLAAITAFLAEQNN